MTNGKYQFEFNNDTLSYILNLNTISLLTGSPELETTWPISDHIAFKINRLDSKTEIKGKMQQLSNLGVFESAVYYIQFMLKDITKEMDESMKSSEYWNITQNIYSENMLTYYFNIHFYNGLVEYIEVGNYKIYGYN